MNRFPEITVGVVTYNSVSFVIETLESIFNQNYKGIHLIISDDASQDDTVEIVKKWLSQEKVKPRFLSVVFLTVPHNTGVSSNCNRVIDAAPSEWIKFVAGDDILLPECISDNLQFVNDHPEVQVVFSQVKVYQNTFHEENFFKTTPGAFPDNLFHSSFTAKDQFRILIECDRIHFTPSYFFNKNIHDLVGGFEEQNRLVEDYPMWLKLTKAGIRLHYFHKPTVGYRIHKHATNNTGEVLFKPSVINGYLVRKKYAHPYLPWLRVKQETWEYQVSNLFIRYKLMNPNSFNKLLYRFLIVYGNLFFWLNVISKRIQ